MPNHHNFSVCDVSTSEPLGLLGLDLKLLAEGIVEIVGVMFSPKLQRTTAATEALFLAMRYCFERL